MKTKITHNIVEAAFDLDGSNGDSDNIMNFFNNFLQTNGVENIQAVDAFKSDDLIEVVLNDGSNDVAFTFIKDDEDKKIYLKVGDVSGIDQAQDGEIEVFEIDDMLPYNPEFALTNLSPDFIDWITDDADTSNTNEAFITVIRGGKKVKKKLVRKKRRIRPSAKKRAGYRIAARKRRLHKAQAARKRKRSVAIRNRNRLKKKPKNMRLG